MFTWFFDYIREHCTNHYAKFFLVDGLHINYQPRAAPNLVRKRDIDPIVRNRMIVLNAAVQQNVRRRALRQVMAAMRKDQLEPRSLF